ncbi:MAG: hypothetical protein ACR2OA_12820 [Rubripirellula sp.]|jgi:hypothetical protein
MNMQVHQIDFHRLDMKTRFPFRYGIASMCEVPHLFVRMHVEIDNQMWQGTSSEGLPPKWFTKNPETDFKTDDLPEMLTVIKQAAHFAMTGNTHRDFFSWWMNLSEQQTVWAAENGQPPLLANLGVSLMERAALDAKCRQQKSSLFTVLFQNRLGIELSAIRSHLTGIKPSDILPPQPRSHVQLRHTIGLGDPLTESDIAVGEKLADNLPHCLTSNIERYGLRYFKIKLSGNLDSDLPRMRVLSKLLNERVGESMRFTLDGNEQYATMARFQDHWQELNGDASIRRMVQRSLLFVEQPVHRDSALLPEVKETLSDWQDAPPVIIDESDAEIDSLPTALRLGYSGTSHKNCKGIIKSIAALGTIKKEQSVNRRLILSAEDLGNIGPVALLQDLAVVAALGIPHVERNGHHYFAGLSMFPAPIQNQTARDHPDLYQREASGLLALQPRRGQLQLNSVNAAPLGVSQQIDLQYFRHWDL